MQLRFGVKIFILVCEGRKKENNYQRSVLLQYLIIITKNDNLVPLDMYSTDDESGGALLHYSCNFLATCTYTLQTHTDCTLIY